MTKRHFDRLATELKSIRPDDPALYGFWLEAVTAVGAACQWANASFNFVQFYSACGIRGVSE